MAGEKVNSQIEAWMTEKWSVGVRFLHSEAQWQNLHNGYENPESLGVDRWVALVGAASKYSYPFVVCDIGTAVTIDMVSHDGNHLGGYIIPGIDMMVHSLIKGTAIDIAPLKFEGGISSVPDNSYSAINQGCIRAVVSLIDSIMSGTEKGCLSIITGGGAEQIAPLLSSESIVENNLIFLGIKCITETT